MGPAEIEALFAAPGGGFRHARWRRAWAPVVFGVDDATIAVFRGAFGALSTLARHPMAETDPELGANVLIFCCADWTELESVPDLERLLGVPDLPARLARSGADRYRAFRFEEDGAIRAAFVLARVGGAVPPEAATLALEEAARAALLWGEGAFAETSPLALLPDGRAVLRPEIGALIRAAYDPVLPAASDDPATALRLAARVVATPGPDQEA